PGQCRCGLLRTDVVGRPRGVRRLHGRTTPTATCHGRSRPRDGRDERRPAGFRAHRRVQRDRSGLRARRYLPSPRSSRSGRPSVNVVTAEDLPALAAGAHLLASGAGRTDIDGVLHWLSALLCERGPVPLVQPDELPSDTACAAIGLVGSVTALAELRMVGDAPLQVVRALEARLDTARGAVAALDAATVNALTPVAAAASLGLPLVDCDGMGRVFPLIHQTSFALAGRSLTPLAAVGATADTLVLDATPERAERLLRAAVNVSGGWMLTAIYPTTAARLLSAGIVGSISRAIAVGRALLDAADIDDLTMRLKALVDSRVLGTGRIVELER